MGKPKPKYRSLTEAVKEFKGLLGDMDVHIPKDPSQLPPPARPEPAAKPLEESVQAAEKPKALAEFIKGRKYSSSKSAMDSYRVLSGIQEREIMPWDSGVGQTKSTVTLLEEAGIIERAVAEPDYPQVKDAPKHRTNEPYTVGGPDAPSRPEPSYSTAERLHQHVVSKHAAKHAAMHELPSDQQAHAMKQMAHERGQAAGWLKAAADKASSRGHRDAAIRLVHLAKKHGDAAKMYANGRMPNMDEEDSAMFGGHSQ